MKTIASIAACGAGRDAVGRPGAGLGQRQSLRRQHEPQLRLDQSLQCLWRQHESYVRRRHLAHQRVRRQHVALVRRRHLAHQRLRRHHLRRLRLGLGAYLSFGRDRLSSAGLSGLRLSSCLPRVSDVPGLPPAGRGAVLLVGLLRLRGGRRRNRGHCRRRGRRIGQHSGGHLERVHGGRRRRQRRHCRSDQRGLQRRRCRRGHRGGCAGVGHVRDGGQLCESCPRAR